MSEYAGPVPLRVCVAGVTGWTGHAIADAVDAADDLDLVAGVSRSDPTSFSTVEEALDAVPADVLVDYTTAAVVRGHVLAHLSGASPSSSARAASPRPTMRRSTSERGSKGSASSRPATSRSRRRSCSGSPRRR